MAVGETGEILSANAAFYAALRTGDLPAMEAVWSARWRVSCTHPARPMLIGRSEVMESWRLIIGPGRAVPILCRRPVAIRAGASAMVLCEEHIGATRLLALNAFALECEAGARSWRMIGHHAGETG